MRVLIKHWTGSKSNRIEQFPVDSFESISLGRDTAAAITYDSEKDDLVSRRHALIRIKKDAEVSFTIEDLQSRNGTFVNGQRLTGEQELFPADVVQVGINGPTFTFDLEPRPPHLTPRTKTGNGYTAAAAELTSANSTARSPAPSKAGVGQHTVLNMLSEQFNRVNRNWMYILAGVLALILIIGAGLYYQNILAEKRIAAKFTTDSDKGTKAPEQIADDYRYSIVLIESLWRLVDRRNGRQVFHKRAKKDGQLLPAYVRINNDSVVPWLVLDQSPDDRPVMAVISGSGFVVREDGAILTNKHIVLVGQYPLPHNTEYPAEKGLLVAEGGNIEQAETFNSASSTGDSPPAAEWIPAEATALFEDKKATRIGADERNVFLERAEKLDVFLPKSSVPFAARFIRAAPRADIALVKIDPPDPIKKVELADASYKPPIGTPILAMGYPNVSSYTLEISDWIEGGRLRRRDERVAEFSVVEGIISQHSAGLVRSAPNVALISGEGEGYQLSISATGPGASGGPVIDNRGLAVGIVTYAKYGPAGEMAVFATPIGAAYDDILKVR